MIAMDVRSDPSRDIRDEIAAETSIEEPLEKIWFHKTAAAVIDAGRCVRCGSCIAACPSGSIDIAADRLPTLVRMCTGCSCCWDFCPMAGLRSERLQKLWVQDHTAAVPPEVPDSVGPVLAAYAARARERAPGAQDGGVVTALLEALLERGYVDGALVTRKEGALGGRPVLATTPADGRSAAGSVYEQTFVLGTLAQPLPPGITEIALVGTPCQINGLRALQRFPWRYRQVPVTQVKLAIDLFYTHSFDAQRLALALLRSGVELRRVAKVDIREGQFRVYDARGELLFETRVSALHRAALRGCEECADFTAVLADIAVGNVGSPRGYTTVLVRTDRGAEAWAHAAAALEATPLSDLSEVAALAARNRARAQRALRRPYDPDQPVWISYSEHLAHYLGTEAAPVSPPAHRSHHYTVAC